MSEKWTFEVADGWEEGDKLCTGNELMRKWDLGESCALQRVRFEPGVRRVEAPEMLRQLHEDEAVLAALKTCLGRGMESSLAGAEGVSYQLVPLRVTRTDMGLFDRLTDPDSSAIVRPNGHIIKCADVFLQDEMTASDRLREMLMDPCSENADVFSPEEQEELLFHVFRRLAIGGALNQYEDEIQPLLDQTKLLYKQLVTVQKNPDTLLVEIPSLAYELREFRCEKGSSAFADSRAEEWNFTYIVVDPVHRCLYRWYHSHLPVF